MKKLSKVYLSGNVCIKKDFSGPTAIATLAEVISEKCGFVDNNCITGYPATQNEPAKENVTVQQNPAAEEFTTEKLVAIVSTKENVSETNPFEIEMSKLLDLMNVQINECTSKIDRVEKLVASQSEIFQQENIKLSNQLLDSQATLQQRDQRIYELEKALALKSFDE